MMVKKRQPPRKRKAKIRSRAAKNNQSQPPVRALRGREQSALEFGIFSNRLEFWLQAAYLKPSRIYRAKVKKVCQELKLTANELITDEMLRQKANELLSKICDNLRGVLDSEW